MPVIKFIGHELSGSKEAVDAFNDFLVSRANAECERMDKAQQSINKMQLELNELQAYVGQHDEPIIKRIRNAVENLKYAPPSERHEAFTKLDETLDDFLGVGNA